METGLQPTACARSSRLIFFFSIIPVMTLPAPVKKTSFGLNTFAERLVLFMAETPESGNRAIVDTSAANVPT